MGAGASTAAKGGKKPAKAPSAEAQFKKAQESNDEAKSLFAKLDGNKSGKLTVTDLGEAVKKLGKEKKAQWTDAVINEVVAFFDADADGMLDIDEFAKVMEELHSHDGNFDTASLQARAAAKADAKKVFDEHAKDGVWEKASTGKLIRKLNDKYGYWEDFGLQVQTSHLALTGSDDKKATATLQQLTAWYPTLLSEVAAIEAQWAAEDEAKAKAKAEPAPTGAASGEFPPDDPEWGVHMKRLTVAVDAAWALGKTPLLIDATTPAGDNKNAGFSPLENYYSYSGEVLCELKKSVVEISVKKEKTVDDVQNELGKKVLMALKQGRQLVLLCSNSAPPVTSKFADDERFPLSLLDASKVKQCLGEAATLESTFLGPLLKWMVNVGLSKDPAHNLVIGDEKTRVVVVTKFDPADYREFLSAELPMEVMQPIKVVIDE